MDSTLFLTALLLLICQLQGVPVQDEAPHESPEQSSTGLDCTEKDDGYYPDYRSGCQEFYKCEAHTPVSKGVCPERLLFSDHLGACSIDVECPKLIQQKGDVEKLADWLRFSCKDHHDGYFGDPVRGCHIFYRCYNGEKQETLACPGKYVFNDANQKCQTLESASMHCGPYSKEEKKQIKFRKLQTMLRQLRSMMRDENENQDTA